MCLSKELPRVKAAGVLPCSPSSSVLEVKREKDKHPGWKAQTFNNPTSSPTTCDAIAGRGIPCWAESGLLSNTRQWIVWGDTRVDRARDFIGKRCLGGGQEGKETQEDCSATWLAVLGFMVLELLSGLSLVNHSDSGSFLVVHTLLSQGEFQWGFWEVVGHVVSPLDLSWTLPVGGGLVVPCSLPVPPVVKCKITHVNSYYGAWPGWAVSVNVFPLPMFPIS